MSKNPLFKVRAEVEVDKDALRAIISEGVEEYLNASLARRVSLALSDRIAEQGSACLSEVPGAVSTSAPTRLHGSEATAQPSPRQKRSNEGSSAASSSVAETSIQHETDRPVVGVMKIKTEPRASSQPIGLSMPIDSTRTALGQALDGTAENRQPEECDLTGDDDTDVDVLGDDNSVPPDDFEPPSPEHTLVPTRVPTSPPTPELQPPRTLVPSPVPSPVPTLLPTPVATIVTTPAPARDDPFEDLPDGWKSWYGEVVWCRWKWQWYPACIANPSTTTGEVFELARKWIGRKHLAFFYPAEGFDVVAPENIRPFAGAPIADFARGEHLNSIVPGILVARYELQVEPERRFEWLTDPELHLLDPVPAPPAPRMYPDTEPTRRSKRARRGGRGWRSAAYHAT